MNDERPTLERIMHVASGGWALAILAAAVHHSVFTHVEAGADTVEALAKKAGVSARGAGTLLDGLVVERARAALRYWGSRLRRGRSEAHVL